MAKLEESCKKCYYLTGKKGHGRRKCYCGDCPAKARDERDRIVPKRKRAVKHYYITCKVISFLDTETMFDVVISEEPEKFALRMKKYTKRYEDDDINDSFEMHQWKNISEEVYDKLRPENPSNESCLEMKKEDYGEYVIEEDEEE